MTKTLDEYRHKLINKILFAVSHDEVKRYCDAAVNELESKQLNGYLVARFLEKTTNDLEQFDPMNKEAQQWSNIRAARIFCYRLKQHYSFSHE
ncbi:MAG TPA: hypothetical protein VF476_03260 [Chitinophagaceae bacterium]